MSTSSKIEWTEATWNPILGCTKVSPGRDHCYAITQATIRAGSPHPAVAEAFAGLTTRTEDGPDWTGRVNLLPERLMQPVKWRKPRRIFVNSLADLFHDDVPAEFIAQVFAVMAWAGWHTFQLLTKRQGRLRSLLNDPAFVGRVRNAYLAMYGAGAPARDIEWPLPNVWLGVSVEDQKWADIRIPALLATPAAVRWLSCEPLLGSLDLTAWMPPGFARWRCGGCHRFYSGPVQEICPGCGREGYWCGSHTGNGRPNGQPLGWVVAGGESGPGARPMQPGWVRLIRDQCASGAVPFLFKQWGAYRWIAGSRWDEPTQCWVDHGILPQRVPKKLAGRELDGQTYDEYPVAS